MLKRILAFLLLFTLLAFPAIGENTPKQLRKQTSEYFGTVSALFVYDDPAQTARFEKTWSKTKETLARIERAVSLSVPDSDITRFNALSAGQTMQIGEDTAATDVALFVEICTRCALKSVDVCPK